MIFLHNLFTFLIIPLDQEHSFLSKHISHRGLITNKYKENTIQAFKKTFELGYSLETDLRYTKDNEIICFHDTNLRRIYNINKTIKSLTYSDLNTLTKNTLKIPKLDSLLNIYNDKIDLFLELKGIFKKKVLLKLLKKTKKYKKIIFISFYHKNLSNIKKISSNRKIGASFYKYNKKYLVNLDKKLKLNCLILDKKNINDPFFKSYKTKKYFYTIKKKETFLKYNKSNNLIIEHECL